jgi:sugar/nucleoside kinase (ribokinase family)
MRASPASPEVITIGSIYCDLIFPGLPSVPQLGEEIRTQHFTFTCGGGAFIVAAGLRRLGVRTAAVAYAGADFLGRLQLQTLRRARVDVSHVVRHPTLGAAVSVAFSTAADRAFVSYTGCAAETGALLRTPDWNFLSRARHVHFAGMPRPLAERLPLLDRLQEAGITSSLDIGWNPEVFGGPDFREVLRRVTLFLPSWKDAQRLTGHDTPEAALTALAEMTPAPIIKLGRDGAIGLDDGRPVRVPPPTVEAKETTGAGDAFDAGFLWVYLRREPLQRCLLAGNICGALSTRAPGGTEAFPTRRELQATVRRMLKERRRAAPAEAHP